MLNLENHEKEYFIELYQLMKKRGENKKSGKEDNSF